MKLGVLIYNEEDYNKNEWFAKTLIEKCSLYNLKLLLVFSKHITTHNNQLHHDVIDFNEVCFMLNRSRDAMFSKCAKALNILCFNEYEVIELANHKGLSYALMNTLNIPMLHTQCVDLCTIHAHKFNHYPYVVKSMDGHGGSEVYKVDCFEQFKSIPLVNEVIVQSFCNNPGVDVRVYIVGNVIYKAIKRVNKTSFKSNYTLGGTCQEYTLSFKDKAMIQRILDSMYFDFVGIDFLVDIDGNLLFNEIEDVVGTRMLYDLNILVLDDYVAYLNSKIKGIEDVKN